MVANPTIAIREGESLDVEALDRVLKAEVQGLSGPPTISQYASGASNLTYVFDYPDRCLGLCRPPFGTRPKSGHDMYREYRIMTALKPVFPTVPTTLYYSDDESIIGAEFYVMERVEGVLLQADIPKAWNWQAADARALCTTFIDKLADLHRIDYKAIGLSDFGRPKGYVNRQILGWNQRYEQAWTPDRDTFEDVRNWLEDNRPDRESGASILHGDYRIDNLILDIKNPKQILAILDWEISALGDPLMDLGNTLAYWIEEGDRAEMKTLVRQPSTAPGMFSRKEFLDYYAEKTGADVTNFHFYSVYGVFRLVVILQQIYYRYYQGQTRDKRFASYGAMGDILGAIARDKINSGKI